MAVEKKPSEVLEEESKTKLDEDNEEPKEIVQTENTEQTGKSTTSLGKIGNAIVLSGIEIPQHEKHSTDEGAPPQDEDADIVRLPTIEEEKYPGEPLDDEPEVIVLKAESAPLEPEEDQEVTPEEPKKPVKKDLYVKPFYDKDPLFTTVAETDKKKKKKKSVEHGPIDVSIGKLRTTDHASAILASEPNAFHEVSKHQIAFRKPLGIGDLVREPLSTSSSSTSTPPRKPPDERPMETDIYRTSIKYLMKLIPYWDDQEEEGLEGVVVEERQRIKVETEEIQETGSTEAMRQAQRYLRVHRIFEFLQFMTAHILSACPDDPIEFILELLNKCLIYRAGFSEPPLLYSKKHIDCLFNLMDRMRTGFITFAQYKVGMNTLGICSCNDNPPLTEDGMVTKEYFVEEAYEQLCKLLDDMLRRRWLKTRPPTVEEIQL